MESNLFRIFFYLLFLEGHHFEKTRSRFDFTYYYQFGKQQYRSSSSTFCPKGTSLISNTSILLNGIDFFNFWYPWLHNVFPKCWEAIKPLLCYKIRNDYIGVDQIPIKPCKSVCHKANLSCWMLKQFMNIAPARARLNLKSGAHDLLDCHEYREEKCNANFSYTKYNSACKYPLHDIYSKSDLKIVTKYVKKSLDISVTGCSLLCNNGIDILKSNHKIVYLPILILCGIGLCVSLFTILTFLVDWKCQRRYPAVILFILNSLFFICLVGWLIQFFGIGNLIRCTPDNFRRLQEPQYDGNIWCLVSFVLIYFSATAISCWFVILTYSWYISFKALGSTKNCIQGKVKYFHLIAWSISTFLTVIVIISGEVDSHEFTNICFLGYRNKTVRILFVYFPLMTLLVFGEILILCSTRVLMKLHAECSLFLVPRAAKNITRTIKRLIIYGLIMMVIVTMPILCSIFESINYDAWYVDYKHYIKCSIIQSSCKRQSIFLKKCIPPEDKRLLYFHVELFCLFIACIATNSWTWTTATVRIWMQQWKKITTHDAKQQLQISWYNRMQKKKIAPFIPPLDPAKPLSRRHSENNTLDKPHPFLNHDITCNKRRNSEDIRSVLKLFSAKRCSKVSLDSYGDVSLNLPTLNKMSKSVMSLQNYGHLAFGNVNQNNNTFRKNSSNITLMQLKSDMENGRCSSNLTLSHMKNMRDSVFTPISLTHKENIVADCIPYSALKVGKIPDKTTVDHSICLDHDMEPYSISSVDDVINL